MQAKWRRKKEVGKHYVASTTETLHNLVPWMIRSILSMYTGSVTLLLNLKSRAGKVGKNSWAMPQSLLPIARSQN